ncbi:MAG: hypothetical protein ACREX3_20705 [Gammaproteobacteria bacterium]
MARGVFEMMICGDERLDESLRLGEDLRKELLKLDEELNAVYREVLSKHFDPELLKREQRVWLAARERCAREMNVPCNVFHLYRDRIDNLRYDLTHPPRTEAERKAAKLLSMGSPPGDNFAISRQATFKGHGMEICEALMRWFNHSTPKGDIACPTHTLQSMPGIREAAWKKLDIRQHEALFLEILRAESADSWLKPEQMVRQLFDQARLRDDKLWAVKEDVHIDHRKGKTETIVWHQFVYKDEDCERPGATWLVTDDLREVDKDLNSAVLGASHYAMLWFYQKQPYLIGSDMNGAFIKSDLYSGTFCNIDNFGAKSERRQK